MNSLDRTLELFGKGEPELVLVSEAQRKLDALVAARVAGRSQSPRRTRGWLAAAATAAVVVMAMLWLPFGSAPALAFAKIQEHFRDFRTLRFVVEQRMGGNHVMTSVVSVTQDGNVRTDVGDNVTVIVNSTQRQVLTLMHSARVAVPSPLDKPATKEDAIAWLDDIRDFQGEAKKLPGSRWIRFQQAYGWQLATPAGDIELWATEEGLPLEMNLKSNMPMQLNFTFDFNPTLDENYFSTEIPAGYSLGKDED
jgi:outer membrane lipoprotein-sorting protein